jgi:hypothetical protein
MIIGLYTEPDQYKVYAVSDTTIIATTTTTTTTKGKGKGKAFPLQNWTGPCGSRRLRLQNFWTIGT